MMTMKLFPPKNEAACKGGHLNGKLRCEEGKNVMAERGLLSNAIAFSGQVPLEMERGITRKEETHR